VVVRGTVYASSGVFSGTVYASAGTFTGTVSASTINGGTINSTTLNSSTINGTTINSSTINSVTLNSGVLNITGDGGSGWGYARSNAKWWADGSNGWIMAREPGGSSFTDIQGGSNRIWMSNWGDCGITFPGFTVTNGGLTISQVDVINTLNIAGNAVTVSNSVSGEATYTDFYLWVPPNITATIVAVVYFQGFDYSTGINYNNYLSTYVSINGVSMSVVRPYGEYWKNDNSHYFTYGSVTAAHRVVVSGGAGGLNVLVRAVDQWYSSPVSTTKTAIAFGMMR